MNKIKDEDLLVVKIVSEWDISDGPIFFKTERKAKGWLKRNSLIQEILNGDDTVEDLMNAGILRVIPVKLTPEEFQRYKPFIN